MFNTPCGVGNLSNKAPASHITAKHWCFLWLLMLSERLPFIIQFSGLRYLRHSSDGHKETAFNPNTRCFLYFQCFLFVLPHHFHIAQIDTLFLVIFVVSFVTCPDASSYTNAVSSNVTTSP